MPHPQHCGLPSLALSVPSPRSSLELARFATRISMDPSIFLIYLVCGIGESPPIGASLIFL